MRTFAAALTTVALLCLADPRDAHAAGQRSFVSGSGVDAGTCTLPAPCRSFGYAIGQTLADGEIIVLDSAGYGPVTVGKSITIVAPPGVYAGVSVFSGDGVTVNAGASDVVILRGLSINGLGGTNGIVIQQAGTVHVERCGIGGFSSGFGVRQIVAAASVIVISDSVLRGNFNGVYVVGDAGTRLEILRTRVHDTPNYGIFVQDVNRTAIVDSHVGNSQVGIFLQTIAASTNPSMAIERTVVVDSGNAGVGAASSSARTSVMNMTNSTVSGNATGIQTLLGGFVRVAGTQITGNATGVQATTGQIVTLGTNMLYGNGVNGTFTGSLPPN